MTEIKIRDLRQKEKFVIDDEYLNGYAKLCGWKATLVYMSLCRHADKDQFCFPSQKLMAEQHGVSEDTIKRGVRELRKWNIIELDQKKKSDGTWQNNAYVLLDKSVWKIKPNNRRAVSTPDNRRAVSTPPEGCEHPDRRAVAANKETHREGNTYKDTCGEVAAGKEIAEIINSFREINPSYSVLFNQSTQRAAAERLSKKYGMQKVLNMVAFVERTNGQRYAPSITTPHQLEQKLGQLIVFARRQNIPEKGKEIIGLENFS